MARTIEESAPERHDSELARAAAVTRAETVREHLPTALNAEHQLRAGADQRGEATEHLAAQAVLSGEDEDERIRWSPALWSKNSNNPKAA